ncbi:uroporphyrinogen-III synthase [Isoptericola aurantiacus]|uniref:uroporphyrinogen-III synthase n=1 Tax=Isoptericola aurantiacus TaxID=3377839 RepID=UPI00383A1C27
MSDLTGPIAGRVLLPRPPARAVGLAGLLRDAGVEVTVAPVIERAPATDTGALTDAVRDLVAGRYGWVVITSVNAVDALAEVAPEGPPEAQDAPAPSGSTDDATAQSEPVAADASRTTQAALAAAPVRWAAVGPATVRALGAVGVDPDLVPDDASADGIVAAFEALPRPGAPTGPPAPPGGARRVLLPLGDRARPTLRDGLDALGWAPDVVTAYRTVRSDLPADVVAAGYDAVVVTSGSVAREIADQLGNTAPVVAIGRPSADAAREAGLTVAAVADHPTDAALAAAVIALLERNP